MIPRDESGGQETKRSAVSRRNLLKTGLLGAAGLGLPRVRMASAGVINPLGFCPIEGLPGDLVNLFGPDFGGAIADVSARIVNGSSVSFSLPLAFDGNEVTAQLTAVPPAMTGGHFHVVLGMGANSMPGNMPEELTLIDPIFSWLGTSGSRYSSFQSFSFPWTDSQSDDCLSVWGSLNLGRVGADIVFPLDEDGCPTCPSGTRMTLRAYGATTGNAFEFEYQATLINTTAFYPEHVADALCTVLESTFLSEYSVVMDCTYTMIDETTVNISIGSPDGSPFTIAALNVELTHDDGSLTCDSVDDDSMEDDSMNGDSMNGDSMNGDSMEPDCPSIDIDFTNFIFT
ncbi:MAG: hypothetical protein QNK37_00890 [Acidobacteriota bacterium]|nr:hypothetical protein [Acidobacteriota bacterium]